MTTNLSSVSFEQGLHHCDDVQPLYCEVLRCYLEEFSPLLDEDVLVTDDNEAKIKLHTLKSLTATVGAYEFSEFIGQLFKKWPKLSETEKRQEVRQVNYFLFEVNQKVQHYCNENTPTD